MACIVLSNVLCLCFRASTNHFAESIFCLTKVAASFFCLSDELAASIRSSAYLRLMRISGMENLGMESLSSPFSISSMKSGTICWAWSLYESSICPPGEGFSFTIRAIAAFISFSERPSFIIIFWKCLVENSWNQSVNILSAFTTSSLCFNALSCIRRHSLRSLAPTPDGSKSWMMRSSLSTSSSSVVMFILKARSSTRLPMSLRRYPSSSRLPMMKAATSCSCSLRFLKPSCSMRLWVKLSLTEKVLYCGLSSLP